MTDTEGYEGLIERLRKLVIMDEVDSDNPLGRDAAAAIEQLIAERDEAEQYANKANAALMETTAHAEKAEADMGAWGYYSDEAKEKAREAYRELLGRALIAEAHAEKAEAALRSVKDYYGNPHLAEPQVLKEQDQEEADRRNR